MTTQEHDSATCPTCRELAAQLLTHSRSEQLREHLQVLAEQRRHAADMLAAVTTQIAESAQEANHAGMTEVELTKVLGVSRMTVRKWLGK